jgi:formiminotetrahydrofolate cyclodeaminase
MKKISSATLASGDQELEAALQAGSGPRAGAIAGEVIAAAATIAQSGARRSADGWEEAGGTSAQAAALRQRALRLAEADVEAFTAARAALAAKAGDHELGAALNLAAELPIALAAAAADAAALAAEVAEHAVADVRADAAAAAVLAAAAAQAVLHLVEINLSTLPGDERVARAREHADAAEKARERALAASR